MLNSVAPLVGVLYGRGSQTMFPGYLRYLTVTRIFNHVEFLSTVELHLSVSPIVRIGLALRVNLSSILQK